MAATNPKNILKRKRWRRDSNGHFHNFDHFCLVYDTAPILPDVLTDYWNSGYWPPHSRNNLHSGMSGVGQRWIASAVWCAVSWTSRTRPKTCEEYPLETRLGSRRHLFMFNSYLYFRLINITVWRFELRIPAEFPPVRIYFHLRPEAQEFFRP